MDEHPLAEALTPGERKVLASIEASGKWDCLVHDLSLMIPSFIVMGLGVRFDSGVTTFIGMAVYAVFALRGPLHYVKYIPVMKSLVGKLKDGHAAALKTGRDEATCRTKVDGT